MADGQGITGDVVTFNESGVVLRLPDDKYTERIPWARFSQPDLKKLGQNPKLAPLVEPFLEAPLQEKPRKPEPEVHTPWRLKHAEPRSLFGAMFSSSVGVLLLLLLYAANIYAAYEVSIFRAQSRPLVCGLASIPLLGVLSPIVFLCMPTRMQPAPDAATEVAAAQAAAYVLPPTASSEPSAVGNLRLSQSETANATSGLPSTQVFQRGAFTFNRRFFETKFPGFFGIIRRDAEKEMVLVIKSPRGQFVAQRISRIAANDFHITVQKGAGTEEVSIPFTEVQEVQLKHKNA